MSTVLRRPLSLDRLYDRPSPMAMLLSAWRQARRERGMLPAQDDVAVAGLLDALDRSGWLQVMAPSPARFLFSLDRSAGAPTLSGAESIARHGADLKAIARHLYDDLAAVAFTGSAMLHHVARPGDPGSGAVERLILPFATDGWRVDRLLVCEIDAEPARLH